MYYIKTIWGPGGQEGYPEKNRVNFAEKQMKAAERFCECSGFLLYETGHCGNGKTGAKTIFAKGIITSSEVAFETETEEFRGRKFPYFVKVELKTRINPLYGIPISMVRKIIEKKHENMQRHGGLIEITKKQFEKICLELNNREFQKNH